MLTNLRIVLYSTLVAIFIWSSFANSETEQNRPFTLNSEIITQGSLVIGRLQSNYQIQLNGNKLLVAPDGQFVFGVGRNETGELLLTAKLTSKIKQRPPESFVFNIKERKWKVERIDGLPNSKVNPKSEKLIQRIRKETKLVRLARATKSQRLDFDKSFIKPAKGRISGVYGSQRILNGEKKRPHYGQDIANKVGTPVIAPINGVVTLAETDLFFSGGTIIIDHGFGVSTTYLHLSQLNVKVGEIVNQKDKIGEIGATGRATGPHLDWRLNWNTTRLDPALLVKTR
ncbi:MAG: murein DD-endopeptidase MepM/ murein hydrolase activator NlpD [Polaribacter sp.]|jgi:murein DD-endopeptidase MepM/ murein hydrolase activator NlpD